MPVPSDQELRQRWAAALRAELETRSWTQTKLAAESGVPQTKISQILRGVSGGSNRSRIAIAQALGVEVQEIWGYPPLTEVAS